MVVARKFLIPLSNFFILQKPLIIDEPEIIYLGNERNTECKDCGIVTVKFPTNAFLELVIM